MSSLPKVLGTLVSVRVGRVLTLGELNAPTAAARPWKTAFLKEPVGGFVNVTKLGLAGDAVADPKHHGGVDKAVLMYPADHYPHWREELDLPEIGPGGFGENLTVAGIAESDVCVGDQLKVGDVSFEVSQPREPCRKIDRRWQRRGITKAVAATGRGGWYLRVLQPGKLRNGQTVELLARPFPRLTVAAANRAVFGKPRDRDAAAALLACGPLSAKFRAAVEAAGAVEVPPMARVTARRG